MNECDARLVYFLISGEENCEAVELIAVLNANQDPWAEAVQKLGPQVTIHSVVPLGQQWPQKSCMDQRPCSNNDHNWINDDQM
jgi:hypothetical protein